MNFADEVANPSRMLLLIGPPKNGKSVAAATISEFCPRVLPATEKTYLKDIVWIQFDTNGVESLKQLNLVPHLIDLSRTVDYTTLKNQIAAAIKEIREEVDKGIIKYVVVDTITTMDTVFLTHLRKLYSDIKLQGLMYNSLLGLHMDIAMQLKSLPVTSIVIAHTKVAMNSLGDASDLQQRKRSASLPGGGDIVAEISGKASNFYKGCSDAIWPVLKKTGKNKDEYVILPYGGYGFEGGNRFVGLADEEPANLKDILVKVKKH